jgi:hypothetical protein
MVALPLTDWLPSLPELAVGVMAASQFPLADQRFS